MMNMIKIIKANVVSACEKKLELNNNNKVNTAMMITFYCVNHDFYYENEI
jgi:hypothetical protein